MSEYDNKYKEERAVALAERTIEKLWILCIILILLLVGSNAGWLYYESQFKVAEETTTIEQSVDTGDSDTNITGIGDINYGTSETKDNQDN